MFETTLETADIAVATTATRQEARDQESSRWADLVLRVRARDEAAAAELYKVVCDGFGKYLAWRFTPADAADRLQDVMLCVFDAIRHDRIKQPGALIAFIQTIVRRRTSEEIGQHIADRERLVGYREGFSACSHLPSPEDQLQSKEESALLRRVLNGLPEHFREIIQRSYLQEQSQEQVCSEMHLTPTQYRLMKCRAKARLEESVRGIGKRIHSARPVALRTVPSQVAAAAAAAAASATASLLALGSALRHDRPSKAA